jgi:hypothetical protein
VPETEEQEEAARPEGSFERPSREARSKYETLVLARYGSELGAKHIANAKAMADDDPGVLAEYLMDLLPDIARQERGRRAAGR